METSPPLGGDVPWPAPPKSLITTRACARGGEGGGYGGRARGFDPDGSILGSLEVAQR